MIPNVISRAAGRSTRRLAAVSAVHRKLAVDCTVPSRRSSPCGVQNDEEIGETRENNNTAEGGYDEEGRQIGQQLELEDASLDTEPLNDKELMIVPENEDLNISSGTVYCRKLTLLPPGEKLNVEFDDDGVAIGDNALLFSFFLGQQVRNKAICSVQVKCWDDYKSETLDHLWACITEKWSFDDTENRRECVMKHAQRLFRGARSKLKSKYFNNKNFKIKEECLKNKPSHLTKVEWKFLFDYWSEEAVMEKSKKASESRAHQKMPHYNGTKSFGRTRQEIRKKNGGKCSRVDVLVATRTRKSEKAVNAINLANNTHAVDEINKLKEQREQGLNEKTDEQIIQDVLGKDTHGYLKAYGPGRSITQHFKVKTSRIDLTQEAKLEVEQAKKEAEAVKNDVDRKIADNNAVWEKKFSQLLDFLRAGSDSDDSGCQGSKE
uniref:Transposase n=1 Tax=Chenopodium quinoa TaxID=63459 RepID=A0A803N2F6_CHEQI